MCVLDEAKEISHKDLQPVLSTTDAAFQKLNVLSYNFVHMTRCLVLDGVGIALFVARVVGRRVASSQQHGLHDAIRMTMDDDGKSNKTIAAALLFCCFFCGTFVLTAKDFVRLCCVKQE